MNSTSPVKNPVKKFVVKLSAMLMLLAVPAFVGAQTNKKSTNPPPPPPPKAAPAPPPKAPTTNNSATANSNAQRGGGTSTGNTGRGGTSTGTGGNTGRGGTGTGTGANTGRGGTGTGTTARGGTGTGGNSANTGHGGTGTGGSVANTGNHTPTTTPTTSNHSVTYAGHPGETSKPIAGGGKEFHSPDGKTIATNKNGEVRRIEAPHGAAGEKMVINRGPGGGRIVETGRPGARVVSYGPHRGFVEHTVVGRRGYIARTYVVGGRSYAHVYREYSYRGGHYYRYVPAYYYGPRFYGWALTPWGAPVRYAWFGMATPAPWFGFYAGYFTPYPVYASPDLWLTDYLISENLRLSYENQQAANEDQSAPPAMQSGTATPLTPEMKQMIANEVKEQLDAERAAAAQPTAFGPAPSAPGGEEPPPALKEKFFIVSSNLDITTAQGQTCSLTPGDVIQRTGTVVATDGGVAVAVLSSKPGDCAADSAASVQVADLQEMHNQFREQLDAGLRMLADNQAKGLPAGPDSGARPVPNGTVQPVADAGTQLATQDADAVKVEASVKTTGSGN